MSTKTKIICTLSIIIILTSILSGCSEPTEKDINITSIIVSENGLSGFNAQTEDGEEYIIGLGFFGKDYLDGRFDKAQDVEFYMSRKGGIDFENVTDDEELLVSMIFASIESSHIIDINPIMGFKSFSITHPDYEDRVPMELNSDGQLSLPEGTEIHISYASMVHDFVVGQSIKIYRHGDDDWKVYPPE